MLDRAGRADLLHAVRRKFRELCHPLVADVRKFTEIRIVPVDFSRDFLPCEILVLLPAGRAVADFRPEGHIEKNTVDIIVSDELRERILHVLAVPFIVGAADAVAAGFEVALIAVFAVIFAVRSDKTPLRMRLICPVIKDLRVISLGDDSVLMAGLDHVSEEVIPLQSLVHPPDLRRIIAESRVRLALDHRGLRPAVLQALHIFIHIDL